MSTLDKPRRPVEVGRTPGTPAHRWREPGELEQAAQDTYDGMRSAEEMDALFQARADATPLRVACGLCGWSFEGLAGDARERQRAHLLEQHPEKAAAQGKRKRRRSASLQGSGEKLNDTGINLRPDRDREAQAEAEIIAEQRREAAHAVEARREEPDGY